jgi:glycosidase
MLKIRFLLFTFFFLYMSFSFSQDKNNDKLAIYQIFTRLFANQKITNKFNGNIDENGTTKFKDINNNALLSIKKMGFSHVWFTGVIEHATLTDNSSHGIPLDHPQVVKGIAGSPYSIKDYYDVNPDLAVNIPNRMEEFEELIERTHNNHLKVIIDFVPNHVARQYYSDSKPSGIKDFGEEDDNSVVFSNQNNFYYLPGQNFEAPDGINSPINYNKNYIETPAKVTGNDVFSNKPSINDWYEAIKLNYGVDYLNYRSKHFDPIPDTWLKMKDILLFWAQKGVDGFRCDMAEMVPVEFWEWVIPQVRNDYPSIIFIAEIYNPNEYRNYIFKGNFDYLYDKVGLYDALRRLIEGHGNAMDISKVWQQESGDFSEKMLRFLENHDEQRIASDQFGKNPESALPAMMLSSTLHTGPLMVYFGQELGVKPTQAEGFQGNDGRTTIFDFWGLPELQGWINKGKFDGKKLNNEQLKLRDFYSKMIHFSTENEIITHGKFWDLQYLNAYGKSDDYNETKIFSYLRYSNEKVWLFVYNFDNYQSYSPVIKLPKEIINNFLNLGNDKPVIANQIFEGNEVIKIMSSELIHLENKNSGLKTNLMKNSFKIFELTF